MFKIQIEKNIFSKMLKAWIVQNFQHVLCVTVAMGNRSEKATSIQRKNLGRPNFQSTSARLLFFKLWSLSPNFFAPSQNANEGPDFMCKQCTIEKGQSAINWLGNNTYIIIQHCCSWEIYKRISCCCDYTEPGCCLLGLLMMRRKFAFFEQRRCTHMCAKSVLFWLEQNILVKSGCQLCCCWLRLASSFR